MNSILVTGGAGYIGSHACKALAQAGYLPIAYDNLSQGQQRLVRWGPFVEGDILDRAALDDAFRKWRPLAVLHFAGLISVAESNAQPDRYRLHNVEGTRTLLAAMREADTNLLVFSSSAAVYGQSAPGLIAEDQALAPNSPYGFDKLACEHLLQEASPRGLRAVSLRYFNAAGADPDGETGECHDPETHLVPLALRAADGALDCLTVHGDRHDTPDGTCIRDYVHVSDLADAHVLALRGLQQGRAGGVFNLGNGQGFSVRQVIAAVERVTGRAVPTRVGPAREGDPARLVSDASRARQMLGWTPRRAALDDIVASAWRWHQKERLRA